MVKWRSGCAGLRHEEARETDERRAVDGALHHRESANKPWRPTTATTRPRLTTKQTSKPRFPGQNANKRHRPHDTRPAGDTLQPANALADSYTQSWVQTTSKFERRPRARHFNEPTTLQRHSLVLLNRRNRRQARVSGRCTLTCLTAELGTPCSCRYTDPTEQYLNQ